MLKETEETIVFFVLFLSLLVFQLGTGYVCARRARLHKSPLTAERCT